jgi:hypothetical protein
MIRCPPVFGGHFMPQSNCVSEGAWKFALTYDTQKEGTTGNAKALQRLFFARE